MCRQKSWRSSSRFFGVRRFVRIHSEKLRVDLTTMVRYFHAKKITVKSGFSEMVFFLEKFCLSLGVI
jgi:hypothetical protein